MGCALLMTKKDLDDIEEALKEPPGPYWFTDRYGYARDTSKRIIGYMRGNTIYDAEGNSLGYIDRNGQVRVGGDAFLSSGTVVGQLASAVVEPDGERSQLRPIQGVVSGSLDPDGTVRAGGDLLFGPGSAVGSAGERAAIGPSPWFSIFAYYQQVYADAVGLVHDVQTGHYGESRPRPR